MNEIKDIAITILISFLSFFNINSIPQTEKSPETKTPMEIQVPNNIPRETTKKINPQRIERISDILPPKKQTFQIETKSKETPSITTPTINQTGKPTNTYPLQFNNYTVDQKIKSATANIFCSRPKGNQIQKITGSAVAISNNGVLLTNAHIAEYILLENLTPNSNTLCYIRTGSPAKKAYKAKVIFIPKEWVYTNKDNMKYGTLYGTGENDYALIYLTKKIQDSTTDNLSYINIDNTNIIKEENLILSGYPVIGNTLNENSLYNISDTTRVQNIWSLNKTESDALDTSYTTLAHHGSSGGVGASPIGKLKAIIVATTIDALSSKPNLRLISLGYISADIKSKTGKTIEDFIENAEKESKKFLSTDGINLTNILLSNSK